MRILGRRVSYALNGTEQHGVAYGIDRIASNQGIKRLFIEAYNEVMTDVSRIVKDCEEMRKLLADTTELDRQIEEKSATPGFLPTWFAN